jgi:NDP-sugar pyrophosphorylase family protein
MRFTSNNIETVADKEVEAVGVFTTTPQQFEPSVEELLQQEFGTTATPTSNIEIVASIEPQLTLGDMISNETTLFNPEVTDPVTKESTFEMLQQKLRKRNETIRKVFTTVQTGILYWFENVEDERIDK